MLNVAIGNGALANGFCCVSVGDGSITRGAFQVRMTEKLSIPSEITVQNLDNTVAALQDLCLTYQAMVEQNHAPAEFAVRAKAAIDVAVDALNRKKAQMVAATSTATTDTPTPVSATPAAASMEPVTNVATSAGQVD